ncbi:DP-EP family protein [Shewanella sp. 10N.286.54.B9]|uniref:DP-EP family protein n=1 Tax=Shewanella sp. 10N.286.54.B9 TaxID=3229719 RepID=UPI00354B29E3
MPNETKIVEFTLTVTLNNDEVPQFNYTQDEDGKPIPVTGSFVVSEPTTIRYYLVDKTEKGLEFTGAAFATPFDNIIDEVELGQDNRGSYIDLIDTDAKAGKTGFRFVLSNQQSNLMILSPDPEVINRGEY